MSRTLPTRWMHAHPDLDQLKRQAKELLRAFLAEEPDGTEEVHAHYTAPIAPPSPCMMPSSLLPAAMDSK